MGKEIQTDVPIKIKETEKRKRKKKEIQGAALRKLGHLPVHRSPEEHTAVQIPAQSPSAFRLNKQETTGTGD